MTEPQRPVLRLKLPAKVNAPKPLGNKIVLNIESAASLFPQKPVEPKAPSPAKATTAKAPAPSVPKPRHRKPTAKKTANLMPNEEYKKLFKQVALKYPKLFDINNKKIRVLAVGVRQAALAELGWSAKTGRDFFFIYCNSKKYKQARIKGANRYDLQGKVVGKVE